MNTVKLETVKNWQNIVDPSGVWLNIEMQGRNVTSVNCLLCSKFREKLKTKRNFNPAFINGVSGPSLKKDNIVKHWKSEMHSYASNLDNKPDSLKKIRETPIGKSISKANNEEESRISKLIEIAYFIAKNELSFALFPEIAKLEKKHGVNLGNTYINDKKCQEFTECIADTLKEDLQMGIKDAQYVSIMVDESTDISVNEKLLVYMRFLGSDGFVRNKFIALRNLSSATAKGIFNLLLDILREYGIDDMSERLVGFCSDGASVNLGKDKGLVTKIQKTCPWLIAIHCFNHRLELAVKDSMAETYFEKVISVMKYIYSFYKKSPKRRQQIADLAIVLHQEENCKNYTPTNIQGTRWIEFKRRAALAVINSYAVIISHLENTVVEDDNKDSVSKCKIQGYLKILKSKKFVFYLLLMHKVCKSLGKLSLSLQADSCNLLNAKVYLEQFEIFVEKMKCEDADNEEELLLDEDLMTVLRSSEFCNVKLTKSSVDVQSAYKYLESLTASLKEKFCDLSSGAISCLKILDTSIWPQEKKSLLLFGNAEVKTLMEIFNKLLKKKNVDVASIQDELKSNWLSNWQQLSREAVWNLILKSKRDLFPNLSHIFEILLIVPSSNAVVERCFSYMTRIKSDYRSRLGEDVLENLMRICVDGPEIENFSSYRSMKNFFSKPRRPSVCPYGKRERKCIDDNVPDSKQAAMD